jgi:hypothetical protein
MGFLIPAQREPQRSPSIGSGEREKGDRGKLDEREREETQGDEAT